MTVQQHVLNWLYSILTSEYHDVNRTYNDVAQTLSQYSSLSPRTDVHTFPNGASALLLHLSGTLPVNFRGSTYRFPVSVWVPHAYPREAPLVYVTPTDTMMIRPGQHVDPQGQVYHPYLVGWAEFWDKSTIRDFLAILSDIFAKEPPVVSRQQSRPSQSSPPSALLSSPPPLPPLPPEMAPRPESTGQARPPPPPPKPQQDSRSSGIASPSSGPPLPAIPPGSPATANRHSRYESAPPLPPQNQQPASPPLQDPRYQQRMNYTSSYPPSSQAHAPPGQLPPANGQPVMPPYNPNQWQKVAPPPTWTAAPPQPVQSQIQSRPQPPPDILDEPLTLSIPDRSVAAPPIPPNPEKDALLRQLAQTLASIRQQSRQNNESTMAGLQAQRTAMLTVLPTLQSEMGQLTQLSNVLASNTSILHDALRRADAVIEGSGSHAAPDIDELLVAPTVVSNQLYNLVAEERALGDAIFMLGRAVERGRISPAVFTKMTRSLAREWYLKKALARKIAKGMGLAS